MEKKLEEMIEDLKAIEEKGYGKKLTDDEGFPRPDVDFGELSIYKQLKQKYNSKYRK